MLVPSLSYHHYVVTDTHYHYYYRYHNNFATVIITITAIVITIIIIVITVVINIIITVITIWSARQIVAGVLGSVLLLAGVVMLWVYRGWREEQEIMGLLWKIDPMTLVIGPPTISDSKVGREMNDWWCDSFLCLTMLKIVYKTSSNTYRY